MGPHITMGTPRFEAQRAPARSRTGYLLGERRRGGLNAFPTGLQLHPGGIFETILKKGAPEKRKFPTEKRSVGRAAGRLSVKLMIAIGRNREAEKRIRNHKKESERIRKNKEESDSIRKDKQEPERTRKKKEE